MKTNLREKILLAAMGIVFAAGCATSNPPKKTAADAPTESSQIDARRLFAENCARCHGLDGRANTFHGFILRARNFTYTAWQTSVSDAKIVQAIQTGPGAMPAFNQKLSEVEIAALAAYVRTFSSTNLPPNHVPPPTF